MLTRASFTFALRFDAGSVRCPLMVCLHIMSIRIGQAEFCAHFLRSRSFALDMTISFRMTAVMANLLHFPVGISC
jgi:hypothetical protein